MNSPADRPVLSAAAMLGDRVPPLPARAVVVFDQAHVPKRKRRRSPAPFRQVAAAGPGGEVAVVATVGPGGPTAAVTVEFLAHLGVRAAVAVGVAGDLTGEPDSPKMFPVGRAVAEEGTARRYGSGTTVNADPVVVAALAQATGRAPVAAVSTDTPLRHTAADIVRFRQSAQLVEMETAALFAAGHRCGVRMGALLVPSDAYRDVDGAITWSAADPATVAPTVLAAVQTAVAVLAAVPDRDLQPPGEVGR